jgi:hypothetical protein
MLAESDAVTPLGTLLTLKPTGALNPPLDTTKIVKTVLTPGAMYCVVGCMTKSKSALATPVTVRPTIKVCRKLPYSPPTAK